jgi:hypothetical protein
MRTTLQSIARKNRFSIAPPDKRFSPFTTLFHETLPISTRRTLLLHLNHRQRKPQLQFVFEVNLDVMHPVLLKLHTAKIMNICRVAFHLFEHELNFRLRDYLLFVHADEARFLTKFARPAAPAGPDAEPEIIDGQ